MHLKRATGSYLFFGFLVDIYFMEKKNYEAIVLMDS